MQAAAAPWGRAAAARKAPAAAVPAALALSLNRLTLDARAGAAGAPPFPTARAAAPLSAGKGALEHCTGSAGAQPGALSNLLGAPALASALHAHGAERSADTAAGRGALPWAPQAPCPSPNSDPNLLEPRPSSSPARLHGGEGYEPSLRHTHADAVLADQSAPMERSVCSAADVFGPLTAAEQAQLAPAQRPNTSADQPHAPGMHGVQLAAEAAAGEGMCELELRSDGGAAQPEPTAQAAAHAGSPIRGHQGTARATAEQAGPVPQAPAMAGSPVRDQQGLAAPGSLASSNGPDAQGARAPPCQSPARAARAPLIWPDTLGPGPSELRRDAPQAAGSGTAADCLSPSSCPASAASADVVEGHGLPRSGDGASSGSCTPLHGTSIAGHAIVRAVPKTCIKL